MQIEEETEGSPDPQLFLVSKLGWGFCITHYPQNEQLMSLKEGGYFPPWIPPCDTIRSVLMLKKMLGAGQKGAVILGFPE